MKTFKHKSVFGILILYVSLFLLIPSQSSVAQITYTDIEDTILTFPANIPGIQDETDYFYFDLDQDGNDDFYFNAHYWEVWVSPHFPEFPHYVFQIHPITSGTIANSGEWPCAIAYQHWDPIEPTVWHSYGDIYAQVVQGGINCDLPYEDKYFGLRLVKDDQDYYGWLCLDASFDTLRFKGFAINNTPGEMIRAGQTEVVGITQLKPDDRLAIYFNGNELKIKSPSKSYKSYKLFSLDGSMLKEGIVTDNSIPIFDLPRSIYVVQLFSDDGFVVKKVSAQ